MAKDRKIGNREKALLHVAKAQLGMDEDTYREMLAGFGVSSSVDLTHTQFDEIMQRIEAAGFIPMKASSRKPGMYISAAEDRAPMLAKCGRILGELGMSWAYADGISKQMFGIRRVRWCRPEQLRAVLVALIKKKKSRDRETGGEGTNGHGKA